MDGRCTNQITDTNQTYLLYGLIISRGLLPYLDLISCSHIPVCFSSDVAFLEWHAIIPVNKLSLYHISLLLTQRTYLTWEQLPSSYYDSAVMTRSTFTLVEGDFGHHLRFYELRKKRLWHIFCTRPEYFSLRSSQVKRPYLQKKLWLCRDFSFKRPIWNSLRELIRASVPTKWMSRTSYFGDLRPS